MAEPVRILSLSTAVPPIVLHQKSVVERARLLFKKSGVDIDRLLPVYANAGIETRYSCVPIEWYLEATGFKARNTLFIEHAVILLRQAAEKCLAAAGIAAEVVDTIVTVSTSGIATPSLDARLMETMPLRRDIQRLPIFGLGCAGGVSGFARAAAMAQAEPGSLVLFLVVELCGLTFRSNDMSKSNVIATALFGDGAAAALVRCGGPADTPALVGWGEHTWPDTLDIMGWRVEDDGLGVLFSRDIPAIVRDRYGVAVDAFLSGQELSRADLDGVLCHPGGAKVIDALEDSFGLAPGQMTHSRQVLRDFGNMSAATIMFVLDRALRHGIRGRHLLSSLGPGFTAAFALMEAP